MSEEERELILRCKRGDRAAFEPVVKAYMKRAYFAALSLVGNREDALDLSQEAFANAYRFIRRFDPDQDFYPWLYRIVKNLCMSHLRKKKRRDTLLPREPDPEITFESTPAGEEPSLIPESGEMKEVLWRAIRGLPDKEREVIVLKHFQEMSYKQIAASVGCPIGTVMSRLYSARQRLKEKMKKYL
ncbi:MAG: sigma-70 family RNA polymerase sigma factor [Planctomycetes bacterium]|nr:sigma-70 family RNA polymerase sigma factor [Planctomycetota bacterium]